MLPVPVLELIIIVINLCLKKFRHFRMNIMMLVLQQDLMIGYPSLLSATTPEYFFQDGAALNQNPDISSCLDRFLKFLPVTYLQTILIPATNYNPAGAPHNWPKILRFIGLLIFLMSSVNSRCD